MKNNFLKKLTALLLGTIMVFSMIPAIAIGTHAAGETYKLVTSVDDLEAGASYLLVCSSKDFALGAISTTSTKYGTHISVTINDSDKTITNVSSDVQIVTLGGSSGAWTLKISSGYLSWTSGNSLLTSSTANTTNQQWKISFDNSGNAVIQNAKDTSRKLQYNASSPRFACYTSSQTAIQLYKLEAGCTHDNIVAIGTPSDATCTEPGITAGEKCSDCGEIITAQKPIEASGHADENPVDSKCDTCGASLCTEHVWVDGEVKAEGNCTTNRVVAQICDICGEPGEDKVTTAPGHTPVVDKAKDATCTETGLTEGSHCDVCDEVLTKQETVQMLSHKYDANGVCTACGAEKPVLPTFEKVTSTLDDFSGTYLIVYEAGKLAFNGSISDKLDIAFNTFAVTIDDGKIIGDFSANVFVIEAIEGGYAIKSASGRYIGKTSGGNGINENTSTKYLNTIALDDSGNAVITASGGSIMRFNKANDQMRFRYYGSGQQPVALYKLVEETPEPEVEAPVFTGFGLTLNKGVTVRVKFNVTAEWLAANPTAKVVFSNGEECTPIVGENTYTTTLTPGQIGDDLTVTLGDVTKTVSVSTYIEKAKAKYATDTKLCTLLDAIEAYGKAAAKVEQSLTAPDFNAIADHVVTDKSVITGFTDVVLAEYATIGLNINAEDGYTFVASRGTATTGKMVLADNLENGVLYIDNIRPANFGDIITVTIYDGDTVVSTIDFTFNSYLKLAYDEAANDLDRNIVIAAYNYGAAAAAYVGA